MTGNSRKLLLACLLTFVGASLSILVQTYSSMVFLSHYSADKIPYLFLTSGLVSILMSQLLKNAIGRDLYGYTMKLHFIFIAILVPFIGILSSAWGWLPFLFSVLLLTMYGFSATVFGTVETCPFNLREFKAIGYWLSAFGALGGVTWGMLVPVILQIWPPISLLVFIISMYLVAILLVRLSKASVIASQSKVVADTVVSHLFQHRLVISVFVIFAFGIVIATFADYSVKSLLTEFGQVKIGDILAPFYAITNTVAVLCQFFITPKIIKRYGVFGLLYSYPIAVMFGALLLLVHPALSATLVFGMMVFSTHYAFFYSGKQMITNILPDTIRTMTGYQLQSIGKNIAIGVAALLLIPIGHSGLRVEAGSLILLSFALLYYLRLLHREYDRGLKESINLHRFNLDFLSATETDNHMLATQAEIALKSEQPDVQLFGLELLQRADMKKVPEILYHTLESQHVLVLRITLKIIRRISDPTSLPILKKRLDSEKKPRVIWHIVRAMSNMDNKLLLPFARQLQHAQNPYLQCSMVCIFLNDGDIDEILFALDCFKSMIHHPSPKTRGSACEIFPIIQVGDLSGHLILLLHDKSDRVVQKALKVARHYPLQPVIAAILEKIQSKRLFLAISKTLIRLGPIVIPQLVHQLNKQYETVLIPKEINLLSKIRGEIADRELLYLLDHDDRRIQDLTASHLAYRAIRFTDHSINQKELFKKIQYEVTKIQELMLYASRESDESILSEIHSRIWLMRKKYLNLIIATTANAFLLELLPTLLLADKSLIYLKSLELLETGIPDQALASTIEFALEGKFLKGMPNAMDLATLSDPWLNQLVAFKNGQLTEKHTMDIINKVLVLRKVALFKHLTAESLEHIAETLTVIDATIGDVIFRENDFANGLYIVAKGQVDITINQTSVRTCHEADFFGELALLDNEPRSATVTASSNSLLFLLAKEDFNRITDDIPEILKVIVQTIMKYLRPYLSHH